MSKHKNRIMNSGPTYGGQSNVQAADIAFSIHASVDSSFYDVLYPEHEWYNIIQESQVKEDVSSGATSYSYITRDKHGTASFMGNGKSGDIPMVGQSAGAVQVPIGYSAVGSEITNEDARQYTEGFNGNLAQDLGEAMRKAMDNLVESTVIFGYKPLGFQPWINYDGVTVTNAKAGASGETDWESKTPEEIVADINDALTAVWEDSRTLFKPHQIFLPLKQFSLIGTIPMVINGTGLAQTVLEFVEKNNIITRLTGKPIEIKASRYLAEAGSGSTDRMVIQDRHEDYQCLPFPMLYTLTQPVPVPLGAQWYAEQKFGSYHVRQKGSMRYVDGI